MPWLRGSNTDDMVRALMAGTSTIEWDAASVGHIVIDPMAITVGAMDPARMAGIGTATGVCVGVDVGRKDRTRLLNLLLRWRPSLQWRRR